MFRKTGIFHNYVKINLFGCCALTSLPCPLKHLLTFAMENNSLFGGGCLRMETDLVFSIIAIKIKYMC